MANRKSWAGGRGVPVTRRSGRNRWNRWCRGSAPQLAGGGNRNTAADRMKTGELERRRPELDRSRSRGLKLSRNPDGDGSQPIGSVFTVSQRRASINVLFILGS
ncbi:hypothetical protein AVEN_275211-1 [Araneus ventricosus]|uniref:Uncharacterized protein n=1 Tax=Araneus ventricosus TaxID=182803 RepID=A0A4Y2NRZ7_ARAVE|nr:hypothetical protein AVEN_275211-1 [Araneus ventricosus]